VNAASTYYGAEPTAVDFIGATEDARTTINQWVSDHTGARIPELLAPGILTADTRLVLTNAVYFKASWRTAFALTQPGTFATPSGPASVQLMQSADDYRYFRGDDYAAVLLPYLSGGVGMLVVLPDEGAFEAVEARWSLDLIQSTLRDASWQPVRVELPRFRIESAFSLGPTLSALGMPLAFDPGAADFSGLSTTPMFISAVIHKTFLAVDESGTEAAAATAVIMGETRAYMEPPEFTSFRVDRPFLVAIGAFDQGTLLFMGRVLEPE